MPGKLCEVLQLIACSKPSQRPPWLEAKGEAIAQSWSLQPLACSRPALQSAIASICFPSHAFSVSKSHERSFGAQPHPVTLSDMGI